MTMGMTTEMPVTERRCENCACYMNLRHPQNPMLTQGFCRRDTAGAQNVRVEVPRLKDGKTIAGKDGKPVMEMQQKLAYVFAMTAPELVCFDGWRPLGTRPGDEWSRQWGADAFVEAMACFEGSSWDIPKLIEIIERFKAGPPLAPPAANSDVN